MIGPDVNQCSAACSILAATHWNSMARSSMLSTPSASVSSVRRRSGRCRWVLVRASVPARCSTDPLNTPVDSIAVHRSTSCATAAGEGSAAISIPLIAPNGGTQNHVRANAGRNQRSKHADLNGAEMTTAAQHKGNLATLRRRPARISRFHDSPIDTCCCPLSPFVGSCVITNVCSADCRMSGGCPSAEAIGCGSGQRSESLDGRDS